MFLVVAESEGGNHVPIDSCIGKLDKSAYPETYTFLEDHAWFVAANSPTATAADLVAALAPQELKHLPAVVVLRVGDYHGVAEPSLWSKLDAWESVSNG